MNLWECIRRLEPLNPSFVSVTYGAGGTTRERTHRTVKRILEETSLRPAAHLTCVDASREEVDEVVARLPGHRRAPHRGAARRPAGGDRRRYTPPANGYANATELTAAIARSAPIRDQRRRLSRERSREPVGEPRHRRAEGQGRCRRDAGDQPVLLRLRRLPALPRRGARRRDHRADRAGDHAGDQLRGVKRWPACAGRHPRVARQPVRGPRRRPRDAPPDRGSVAAETCARLEEEGFSDFHFYTLNRADLVYAICHLLSFQRQRRAEGGVTTIHPSSPGLTRRP